MANQNPTDPKTQAAFDTAFQDTPDVNTAFEQADNAAPLGATNDVPASQPEAPSEPVAAGPVNVVNPEGKLVSIPGEHLTDALGLGYQIASPEAVAAYKKEQKYSTPGQEALSALEGAGEGATFGLSTAAERAAGINPEDIQARREVNPGLNMLGQVGSLLIPGAPEAEALEGLGKAGAALVPGSGLVSKIGSAATKAAIENGLVQGGDEVSKMISQDPNQSAQTAMADIGLSSLLGGTVGAGFGAVSPIWKATMGGRLGKIMQSISDHTGGIEGVEADPVNDAIQASGMAVAPEVRAALGNDPEVRQMFQTLQESSTSSGIKAQEALKTFRSDAADQILASVGKTPEDVAGLTDLSEHDIGADLKNSLVKQLKETIDPISEQFDQVKERFKNTELDPIKKAEIAQNISQMAAENGYNLSPSAPQAKIVNQVLEEIPGLKTLEDLRKYSSLMADRTQNPELWRLGSQLRKVFRGAEETTLDTAMGQSGEAGDLIAKHAAARSAYSNAMNTVDSLNDRLHVGKYAGPGSFISALKDMAPEDVLRRLSPKGDAGIIGELSGKFPETASKLQDFHLSQALKNSASRASPGESINSKVFYSLLDKMSPEMRQFVVPEGAQGKLDAIQSLLEGLPSKMNNSGTAKTMDALWGHVPGSAVGLATMLLGHNPVLSVLLGGVTKLVSRDAPDAARLALLKFLGSGKPIESEGLKTAVDFIHHTIQGDNLISKATKNLFKAGREVLPQSQMPSESDRGKLDRRLKGLQADQSDLENTGGMTAHYLPEHGQALSQIASNAVGYLNSIRPASQQNAPLDTKMAPSVSDQAKFNRALDIANQPLSVLNRIKDGSISSQDIVTLQKLYPDLYSQLQQKTMGELTATVQKGESVPYSTRLGLSLFLGQPLDSTMTPQGIMAAQPTPAQAPFNGQPKAPVKHKTAALTKFASNYQTAGQAAEADKAKAA